jgi:hypothetical protein
VAVAVDNEILALLHEEFRIKLEGLQVLAVAVTALDTQQMEMWGEPMQLLVKMVLEVEVVAELIQVAMEISEEPLVVLV